MPIIDLDALPEVTGRVLFRTAGSAEVGPCDGGWFFVERGQATVQLVDASGAPFDQLPLPPDASATARPQLAVDPRAGRVGIDGRDRATVINRAGEVVTIAHPAWQRMTGGALAFDPTDAGRDRLWLVAPSVAVKGLLPQPPSGVVSLVDTTTGAVLDTFDLDDDHPEGYTMLVAPGRGVVLNGAYGQDGSSTWCLRTDGTRIEVQAFGDTGVASSFDDERGEIMFMPHDEEDVEVRAWWTGETTAQSRGEELFGSWEEQEEAMESGELEDEPDGFDYLGCFLDGERLAVLTRSERVLVLDRATGRAIGRVVVDGVEIDPVTVERVAPGTLLCNSHTASLIAVEPS
jgi:hypothetical protein